MPALGVYGSGVHRPQYELIARCNPKLVLWGFDMDKAGNSAYLRAKADTASIYKSARIDWPAGDPAACTIEQRVEAVTDAVRAGGYRGDGEEEALRMADLVSSIRWKYNAEMEGTAA